MTMTFYRSIKFITNITVKLFFFILLMLALSTGVDISSGRPEIVINLLLSFVLLVHVYQLKYSEYIYGGLLILIALSSPITGVYCSFILLLYYLYNKFSFKTYLKSALTAIIVFSLFLLAYPYSFLEILNTMIAEANKIVFARDDAYSIKEFVKYHFLSPNYTLYFYCFL